MNIESWPVLPVPGIRNRIHPAAFPGEQLKDVIVRKPVPHEQYPKKSHDHPRNVIEKKSVSKHTEQHHTKKYVLNRRQKSWLNRKRPKPECARTAATYAMRKKPLGKQTKQKSHVSKGPTVTEKEFKVPISNRYSVLHVEELPCQQFLTQMTLNFPTFAKISKSKRKTLRLKRKRKVTKLQCAARGSQRLNLIETSHVSKPEYYYENPHRNSPFETLMWTKVGFKQTAFCSETPYKFDVQAASEMIRIAQQVTHRPRDAPAKLETELYIAKNLGDVSKCKEKTMKQISDSSRGHTEYHFEKMALHLLLLLLLCGDIELNPGPRTKKLSVEAKKARRKLKKKQESELEKEAKKQKNREYKKKHTEKESAEQTKERTSLIATYKYKLKLEEKPECKQKRLCLESSKKSIARSEQSPEEKRRRLCSDAKNKSKMRSEESLKKNKSAYLLLLRKWMN